MDYCMYCSTPFPDSTYLSEKGVCGSKVCRNKYDDEWGLVDKMLEHLENVEKQARKSNYQDNAGSEFISLAYFPKCGIIEKREALKEVIELYKEIKK